MAGTVVVVEYYEQRFGYEEKRLFKVFTNMASFEKYCSENNIQTFKGAFSTSYFDDEYSYIVNQVECL